MKYRVNEHSEIHQFSIVRTSPAETGLNYNIVLLLLKIKRDPTTFEFFHGGFPDNYWDGESAGIILQYFFQKGLTEEN